MGWDHAQARQAKAEAGQYIRELLPARNVRMAHRWGGVALGTTPGPVSVGVALGLAPVPDGSYQVALRYRQGTPSARMVAQRLAERFGDGLDVRYTGRVHPQAPAGPDGPAQPNSPGQAMSRSARPPALPRSMAQELTQRTRPLRPGVSVAHVDVSAGTLGAFVYEDADVHVLSNHHVLIGPDGGVGDVVLQPGPADGGADPADRIGAVTGLVELVPGQVARVDAAVAAVDADLAEQVEATYLGGELRGTAEVAGGEQVQKIGRTTGLTHGVVTAIELDGVLVDFGPGFGTLAFDGQIEVQGTDGSEFSAGGDSGSLVYQEADMTAVGLLFAGSATGGPDGQGLTYLNPVAAVLEGLGVSLDRPAVDDAGDDGSAADPDSEPEPVDRR